MLAAFAPLGAYAHGGLHFGVAYCEAPLDLPGEVVAVELGVLRVELPVPIRDLSCECRRDLRDRQLDRLPRAEELRHFCDPLVDERVCGVEPCDGNGKIVERVDLLAPEAWREDPQQLRALLDASRHRADGVEARRERKAAVGRHEVERRLEPDDATTCR